MSEKETTTAAERKVEWETIKTLLPRDKTPEDKQRRLELFKRFDKDGSGSLTFDETYKACVNVLHLNKFTSRLRDITRRAYNKAKSMGTKDRNEGSEDEVEFLEFRLMLCYIYDYFELTVMFDEIDADGSMMIDMDEFKAAVPKMKDWGLTISDPVKTFNEVDDNGSGKMTFDEFCTWAVEKRMDRDGDPDKAAKVAEALATPVQSRSANIPEMPRVKNMQAAFGKTAEDRKQAWLATRDLLPTEKTPEQKKQRVELFDEFDKQKSGALTYDEVYKGCVNVLHLNEVTTRLRDVTKRAYNKACGMGNQERSQGEDDLVEFLEFRLMLCYLKDYFDLTVLFNDIDTSGDGLVDPEEFKVAAQKVTEYGLPIDDPEKTFNEIDDNGSGQISFDEFASWAAAKKLEQDGDPDGGAPAQPRSLEAGNSAQPKAGRFRQAAEDATPEEKKEAWKAARALIPTEKTPEQKQQRIELFYKFDKDGSNSLNYDEVYKGCVNVIGLHKITTHLRDITKRAFNQSRTMGNQERGQGDEDLVEFLEFRLLMCYIADYFDLSALFDEMDTSGDHLVSKDEFMAALPKVEAWGLKIEDPEATFNALDNNASGEITFDEFCAWATAQKLEQNGDPDGGAREAPPPQPPKQRSLPGETTAMQRKVEWDRIRELIPRQKTPEDKQRRIDLFAKFDKDGSGSLTFDETYKGCVNVLHLNKFTNRLRDITKRAYNKAKSLGTEDRGAGSADEVEFLEFRLMLCYIYDFFELTVMFDEIDADGSMMIDQDEFMSAIPKMREWGLDISDPEGTYAALDGNGSGKVTFDEFCAWAVDKKMDVDGDPDNIH